MRTYDLVMTHKLDADDFFIHRVQQRCAELGLNFFLIEPSWVHEFLAKLEQRHIHARVLLNLHSEHHQPDEPYHRLVRTAFELGVRVIDPPAVARAAFDKARLHPRLLGAGFHVPFTVIVPRDEVAAVELSPLDRANLGTPFVIKPGLGYGKRGVILDATGRDDLLRSAAAWPETDYLLQRRVVPRTLDQDPAYFRLFHAFGQVWCCWWNCFTDRYRAVSDEEMRRHQLQPLLEIPHRLAALTAMTFFSTEVALTDRGEYILIDYLNDQCHMLSQSANPAMGVPDEVVVGIARRLVEGAKELIQAPLPILVRESQAA